MFDDEKTTYDLHVDRLKDRIHELRMLRDAQADGSAQQDTFQQEINAMTREFLAWREVSGQLAEMDRRIARAELDARTARRKAHAQSDSMWRAARTLGVFGGLALLVAAVFNPHWLVWLVALALVGGAVGAVAYGTRTRAGRHQAIDEANSHVEALVAQRDLLIPGHEQEPERALFPESGVPAQEQHPEPQKEQPRLALVSGDGHGDTEVLDAELVD